MEIVGDDGLEDVRGAGLGGGGGGVSGGSWESVGCASWKM